MPQIPGQHIGHAVLTVMQCAAQRRDIAPVDDRVQFFLNRVDHLEQRASLVRLHALRAHQIVHLFQLGKHVPQGQQNGLQIAAMRQRRVLRQIAHAILVCHVKAGQDLARHRQVGVARQPAADKLPIAVVQPEQRLDVVAEHRVPADGKEKPVDQEYDRDRRAQIDQTQGDCGGSVHRHAGKGQRVTGRKDRVVPCAGCRAVHQRDHYQRKA